MSLLSKLNSAFLSRWVWVFRQHRIQSANNDNGDDTTTTTTTNTASNGSSSSGSTPLAVECYACTQAGVPAFHSTSCDRAHAPEWEASAGSSLIPIRNNPPKTRPRRADGAGGGVFGRVLDPRSKRVQRWNRAILLARAVAVAVDPLFFYSLSIGRGGAPCLYMDGGLALIVTLLRTLADAVHLMHVWLQFRVAYVSRESLVVGCGKLVWDARAIAEHYARSIKGLWFDIFVILPVPQKHFERG